MNETLQRVEVWFVAERVSFHVDDDGTAYTLFRTPEGRYMVHTDEGGRSWLEAGIGDGIEEQKARYLWPELFAVA